MELNHILAVYSCSNWKQNKTTFLLCVVTGNGTKPLFYYVDLQGVETEQNYIVAVWTLQ